MPEGDLGARNHVKQSPVPSTSADDTVLPQPTNGDHANGTNGSSTENGEMQSGSDGHSIPQPNKRKFDSITKSGRSSRAPSPPWKLPTAEDPSAKMVNGRRQSARVIVASS